MSNKRILQIGLISAIALVTIFVFSLLTDDTRGFQRVDTSVAMTQLQNSNAREVQIDDREQRIRIELREPITYEEREGVEEIIAQYPARTAPQVFDAVQAAEPDEYNTKVTQDSFLMSMLGFLLPMLLLFGLLMFFLTRMQGGGGMFGFGGSKAKELTKDMPTNTFADVAGADEAVSELEEIKDFLQDPTRYHALGAKIPRGVLLYGPPGTGKTLLARAVAGEAGVPFYSISGSDFVEMFVGVGASRVRDLFEQAKKNAPCIIFIDEIDAIGKSRDSRFGGNDEREQTLNQLQAEMDGFEGQEGIVVLAATNRPEVLDKALLRPGRFDRRIIVEKPDLIGREAILEVHAAKVKLDSDVNLRQVALATSGATGADLANMVNEAALEAVKHRREKVSQKDLLAAVELVIAGKEKKDRVMNRKEREMVAYHEVGHALVSALQSNSQPVQKITIVPRTMGSLGYTMNMPEEERYLLTKSELLAQITTLLGGRAAETVKFGEVTTGASNDIQRATKLARSMVTQYGMSEAFGPMGLETTENQYLDGRNVFGGSDQSSARVDQEVRGILDKCQKDAIKLIEDNAQALERISAYLLDKENITGEEFMDLLKAA